MITLYRTSSYGEVQKIEATRVTDSSYFALDYRRRECRNALHGARFSTFKNEADAIFWLRSRLKSALATSKESVDYHEKELEEFNAKYPEQ